MPYAVTVKVALKNRKINKLVVLEEVGHTAAPWFVPLPYSKKVVGSHPGPGHLWLNSHWVKFASTPHVCVDFLQQSKNMHV